ncbi:hypothetical protein GCM10010245_51990 [Streptomyces spectabilis]|uniref:Uncharacterized protein n=1 Tax=Streptomyces spectabilis TaxID=68270 RepID=A0A5P2XGJ9_STRST|nr:hypothetical protein [Streptomyces spectabilis]QEV64157.1 hypothetical protein CP982_40245 [Streptomyces spectabilis]GGV32020.1 hypothetical protein GCM10010245_51990 [Streptomyces spectabilis]
MAQWDTHRQEWVRDTQGPPPGLRGSRILILATVAILLCCALGYGAWLLLRGIDWGSDEPFPGVSLSAEHVPQSLR